MIESGLILFVGVLVILGKMPRPLIKKILGYELIVDVFLTLIFPMLMYGTYSGMIAAFVAGIAISAALRISKYIIGYQVWSKSEGRWIEYRPAWRNEISVSGI